MHLLATIDLPDKHGTQLVREKGQEPLEGTIVPLRMVNLLNHPKRNIGVIHVDSNLHWIRHVQATKVDHEFTPS